jgi:hypothetical protein
VYREISCQKAVNGTNFVQGVQDYNFSTGAPTGWIPSRSYFRIEMELKGQEGKVAPIQGENLAFADSACGNLFDNVYFRGAGQDISSAVNYVSHSQAAKTRLQKSGAWLQSIGKSAYLMESNFQKRVNQVSTGQDPAFDDVVKLPIGDATHLGTATIEFKVADGVASGTDTAFNNLVIGDTLVVKGKEYKIDAIASATALTVIPKLPITAATTDAYVLRKVARPANNRSKVFAIWQPPIGIMDHNDALGAGDWRFQLTPTVTTNSPQLRAPRAPIMHPLWLGQPSTLLSWM